MAKATGIDGEGISTEDQGLLRADEYVFVAIPKSQCKLQGWFMGFQRAFTELAKDKELVGEPRRVLDYMMGTMDFENFVAVEQKQIAEELGMHKVNVSQAIKKLVDKGIIEKGPKLGKSNSYRMNLFYAWKGKAAKREQARKELYKDVKLKAVEGGQGKSRKPKDTAEPGRLELEKQEDGKL